MILAEDIFGYKCFLVMMSVIMSMIVAMFVSCC